MHQLWIDETEHHDINGLDRTIFGISFAELFIKTISSGEMMKAGKASWVLSAALILAGCQTTSPIAKSGTLDDSSFMSLWSTYRHCEAGSDLDTVWLDAQKLRVVAGQSDVRTAGDMPLPRALQQWVSEPANRLAVDPEAMAVACSLHTGQIALSAGRYEVAGEMFHAVMAYPEHVYPYYVSQARVGLAKLTLDEDNASTEAASAAPFTTLVASTASRK